MVGFALALAGGALQGFGNAQLEKLKEDAKAARDTALATLNNNFTAAQQTQRLQFEQGEGAANRASQEKLTNAQLGMNKSIAELGARTDIARTGMTTGSAEKIDRAGNESAEKIAQKQIDARANEIRDTLAANQKQWEAQIKSEERLGTKSTIQGSKDLQQMQIDAAKAANVTFQLQADGTSVMLRNGEPVAMPIDPRTGKPLNPAISDNDTPEMKNFKFMRTVGVSPDDAMQVFQSKNDNPALLYAGYVQTFVKAQTTFGNATDETADNADKWARQMMANSGVKLPATAGAGAPASSTTSAPIVIPSAAEMSDEVLKNFITQSVNAGANAATIRDAVVKAGRNPANLGL